MQRQSDVQISNSIWAIDHWNNAHAPKALTFPVTSPFHFSGRNDLSTHGKWSPGWKIWTKARIFRFHDRLFVLLECSLDTRNSCVSFASFLLYGNATNCMLFSQRNVEHMFEGQSLADDLIVWLSHLLSIWVLRLTAPRKGIMRSQHPASLTVCSFILKG